ncbi:MAG: hypothetical protein CSA22_09590 [Deltaproteobacteria bacterium]|nr:MAG: hypothetical protein CSA22_09590 [Deltaproteobacteria bacterium]
MKWRNTPNKNRKEVRQVAITGTRLWVMGVGIFLLCGWMFFLGVTVGRGISPVRFDMAALQTTAGQIKGRLLEAFSPAMNMPEAEAPLDASDFSFYDKLPSKDTGGKGLASVPVPAGENALIQKLVGTSDAPKLSTAPAPAEPTPLPAKKSAPGLSSPVAGKYVIQVAAFKQKADATRVVNTLKTNGLPAYRVTAHLDNGTTWYRVRVGTYPTKHEADQVLTRIKNAYVNAYLVKL